MGQVSLTSVLVKLRGTAGLVINQRYSKEGFVCSLTVYKHVMNGPPVYSVQGFPQAFHRSLTKDPYRN